VTKTLILATLLIFFASRLMAQQFIGTVMNKITNRLVAYATISSTHEMAVTAADGKFTLFNIKFNDTIRVTSIGYQAYTFTVYHIHTDTIYIEPEVIQLANVNIFTGPNYKADSLKTRKDYASVFNYQKPALKDFLKTNLPSSIADHGPALNSDNDFGGLNLLAIASLFGRNKTSEAKLQKQLQDDEEAKYIDHRFSKSKVEIITHMQGDSLQDFMDTYRPTITGLKQMTDYELIIYIKDSYAYFIKNYKHEDHLIFTKP
jgi:hypothetical protein